MKKLLMLLPAVSLFFLVGCGADNGTSAERQEFRKGIESQIAEFNQRIKDAREKSEELSGESQNEMNRAIDELEEQKDNLAAELEELGEAGDTEWEAAKDEIEKAVAELDQDFNELRRTFGGAFSQFDLRRP